MGRNVFKSQLFDDEASTDTRRCDWPGCEEAGEHRAPKSRAALNDYHWFCMDHVRLYNKNWNYYAGMDEAEIEADMRRDTVWRRPTWKLGTGPMAAVMEGRVEFPFDLEDGSAAGADRPPGGFANGVAVDNETARALELFELALPLVTADLRARYKVLVKKYHPDANGGTKAAEEQFKRLQAAYQTLVTFIEA